MTQSIFIQVKFKIQTKVGEYSDAIYYTESEYANIKQSDINSEAQKRADNYVNLVLNPEPTPELSKNELIDLEAELQQAKIDQTAQLDAQITDIQTKLGSMK